MEKDQAREPLGTEGQQRRDAIKKIGKVGLYAAPAMMLLVHSKKAAAMSAM